VLVLALTIPAAQAVADPCTLCQTWGQLKTCFTDHPDPCCSCEKTPNEDGFGLEFPPFGPNTDDSLSGTSQLVITAMGDSSDTCRLVITDKKNARDTCYVTPSAVFLYANVLDGLGLVPGVACHGDDVIREACGKFRGLTVEEFMALANLVLADSLEVLTPYGAKIGDVADAAGCLNERYDECRNPYVDRDGLDRTGALTDPRATKGEPSEPPTIDVGVTPALPKEFKVNQSYPNPFNPSATIEFALPSDGNVTITVYDAIGRKVATLLSEYKVAGYHQVTWLGKDDGGTAVASGVYFCKVQYGPKAAVQKMILLR
jgi:hypothetical protein